MLNPRNFPDINNRDPKLGECLEDIIAAVNQLVSPSSAPPQITSLSVTAANGIFDLSIFDNNPVVRGLEYFAEYSTTPNFVQPHVIDVGASRTFRTTLGNLTLYWRAYSQYTSSPPSAPVYFGSIANPTAVVGGGAAGPTPQPSTGSGTAPSNGMTGGAGYGYEPFRSYNGKVPIEQ